MSKKYHQMRLIVVACFFVIIGAIVVARTFDLMVLHRKFLQAQGDARSVRVVETPAYRGMIIDRNGTPLAVSTLVESAWVQPEHFDPSEEELHQLAHILKMPPKSLMHQVKRHPKREFIYLKRQLPPYVANKIKALHIPGLHFQSEFKRYYPQGESTAQLIGFTNIDDAGLEGLELVYQDWLGGMRGQKRVLKDRMGNIIEVLETLKDPKPGHDLVLSIDHRIQYLAYESLKETLEEFGAQSGSVVVLDTETGEILAAANAPSFNPNVRERYTKDFYRNKAITDLFEPGSVIKTFSIASALSKGEFTPHTIIDTRPGFMTVQGRLIQDVHNYGILDVTGVLEHSSNVGVTKMVLSYPPEQLVDFLQKCGFGQKTESGYPGESDGMMVKAKNASPFVLATLSFGYSISVTPLQLAKAYLIFANEGNLIPISLLRRDTLPEKTLVLDPKVTKDMLTMLEAVLENGTGQAAKIPGYRVAGKTGTSRVASTNHKGYEEHKHIASFVGIAPVTHPKLIVVVIIKEPSKKGYYGAAVAAPLFKKVMSGSLRILNVPPG